jgi:protein transport protein SEC23
MAFNATLEVKCGKDLKLEGWDVDLEFVHSVFSSGALGNCANMNVKNAQSVSDTEMGLGGTCQWKFAALTPHTTPTFLFEIAGTVMRVCVLRLRT